MNKVVNKRLDKKLKNLSKELNETLNMKLRPKRYKIKVCNNQICLESNKNIIGYLACRRKNIPICKLRDFCPDAHFRYFDYEVKFIKEDK